MRNIAASTQAESGRTCRSESVPQMIAEKAVEGATWAGKSKAEAKGLHRELSALGV